MTPNVGDGWGTSTLLSSLESIILDRRSGKEDTRSWIWDEREFISSLEAKGVAECDLFLEGEAEDEMSRQLLFLSFLSLCRSLDLSLALAVEEAGAGECLEVEGMGEAGLTGASSSTSESEQ